MTSREHETEPRGLLLSALTQDELIRLDIRMLAAQRDLRTARPRTWRHSGLNTDITAVRREINIRLENL